MIGYAVNGNLAEGENKKGDVISQTFANRYIQIIKLMYLTQKAIYSFGVQL